MTELELIAKIKEEVKNLTSYLTDPIDYENALADAYRETGWAVPITDDFKIVWIKQRARRHLFFMLQSESAHKFKYDKINLQDRFKHYTILVKMMDGQFAKAIVDNPAEFAGVDAYKLFGTVAAPGFAYEPLTGRDITYDSDQKVLFNPTENN